MLGSKYECCSNLSVKRHLLERSIAQSRELALIPCVLILKVHTYFVFSSVVLPCLFAHEDNNIFFLNLLIKQASGRHGSCLPGALEPLGTCLNTSVAGSAMEKEPEPRFLEESARRCPPQDNILGVWVMLRPHWRWLYAFPTGQMPSASLTEVPIHGEIVHQVLFIQNWKL